jgi:hypothetical protein
LQSFPSTLFQPAFFKPLPSHAIPRLPALRLVSSSFPTSSSFHGFSSLTSTEVTVPIFTIVIFIHEPFFILLTLLFAFAFISQFILSFFVLTMPAVNALPIPAFTFPTSISLLSTLAASEVYRPSPSHP